MQHHSLPLPRVAPLPRQKNEWVLLEDYMYVMPDEYGGNRVWLPAGLRTDLASVPRVLWALIAPFELSALAPLLHDVLYRGMGRLPLDWQEGSVSILDRKQADQVFLTIMRQEGVNRVKRGMAYAGVRLMGGKAWGHAPIVVDMPLAEHLTTDGELDDIGWG